MAPPKHLISLELPAGSIGYVRALLRGNQASFYHAEQPPIELPAHSHRQGQVSFLIDPASCVMQWQDGRGRSQKKTLNGPHIYVVVPGRAHSSYWEKAAGLLEIYYEPEVFLRMFPRNSQGVYFADAASVAGSDSVIWQLASALRHLCDEPAPDLEQMDNIALGLLSRLGKMLKGKRAMSLAVNRPMFSRDQVRRIREYVLANLRYEIHVADLAKLMDLSVAHFTEVFKSTVRQNPYELISECRMLKAHELLFAGGKTIGTVAKAVGFQDQGYFSRKFQAFFGYGPRLLHRHALPLEKRPNKP